MKRFFCLHYRPEFVERAALALGVAGALIVVLRRMAGVP